MSVILAATRVLSRRIVARLLPRAVKETQPGFYRTGKGKRVKAERTGPFCCASLNMPAG